MISVSLAVAMATSEPPPKAHQLAGAGALMEFGHIYYDRGKHPPVDVDVKLPSPEELSRIIPRADGAWAEVLISCRELSAAGRMSQCTSRVEPTGKGYEAVASELQSLPMRTQNGVQPTLTGIAEIRLQFRVYNTASPAWHGPCWPPSCTITPPPPPPPK